nr:hypothetical protein GCM10020092_059370 [Actinoplanes digitatis]
MAEHFDVLIIGAGLSGIGAAWRLRRERPGTTFAILEARDAIGGTWDLFRFPGVRSDSDMYTLSYPFRPWRGRESMAPGASIRAYIRDTADEGGITPHIRFGARVERADWSDGRWTVRLTGGETLTCGFLYACAGYYDYAGGYQPDFPGLADFAGRFVHPQAWPEDLDYSGKQVVVIGSGATAVTIVPAMAATAGHVTMLQRSPSYLSVLPERDVVADALRRALPARAAHKLARVKNILLAQGFYQLARRRPERFKAILRHVALQHLNDPAYLDAHFTPAYQPWDQRLCVVPGGDLFNAVSDGAASVVTDHIDRFVPEGIALRSGRTLLDRRRGLRDRPVPAADRRGGADRRRRGGGSGHPGRLPRGDAQRGAELRLLHRLHQRLLDAARRPVAPLRPAPAVPPGAARLRQRHAGGDARRAAAAARPHLRLRAAGPGPVPATGRPGPVDRPPELPARRAHHPARRPAAGHDLHAPRRARPRGDPMTRLSPYRFA